MHSPCPRPAFLFSAGPALAATVAALVLATGACGEPMSVAIGEVANTTLSSNATDAADDSEPAAAPEAEGVNTDTGPLTRPVGKVPMNGCVTSEFFAQFLVGSSTLNLLVDSGSTSLAAAASSCKTCNVGAKYQPGAGATNTGKTTSSAYVDGSQWSGTIYTDTVAAGDAAQRVTDGVKLSFAAITSQKSFFGAMTCASMDDTDFDGIIGFGTDAQLASGTTSFLTQLAATGALERNSFATQICDLGGQLWLGGYDPKATTAVPQYTPLLDNRGLTVAVEGMAVGNQNAQLTAKDFGSVAVDTGTNAILLPEAAFNAFERLVESDQAFVDNFGTDFIGASKAYCATSARGLTRAQLDAELPKLSLRFADEQGGSFVVDANATDSYLAAITSSNDSTGTVLYCPAISKLSMGILGHPFMRSHVVIFDREGKRIGFAPQKGCSQKTLVYPAGT